MRFNSVKGRHVIMFTFLLLLTVTSFSQNIVVTGKVNGNNGEPLEGATISIKGTSVNTVSKKDGSFSINAPSENSVLVISYTGYETVESRIGSQREFNLSLTLVANVLTDVVVVGYGTQKKSDVTGSLSRLTADDIQERPTQNVLQALQGKASGVHVSSNLKPGELPVVRVRGNRSISASNDPLYVIDGIPLVNALGVNSFTMADLNPNDIASVEVLKDASATAIYGSRGANGVVLITTNKGRKGRTSVSYSTTLSIDQYKAMTDWMDGGEYVDRWRESLINVRTYRSLPGNADLTVAPKPWYPNPRDDSLMIRLPGALDPIAMASVMMGYEWNADGTVKMRPTTQEEKNLGWGDMIPIYNSGNIRSFDWIDAASRQGFTQNHQISVTAGSELSRMSVSLGYYKQLGVQRDQDYQRYTVSLSGDITPIKWFTLGTSILGSFSVQNYGIQGPNTSNTGSKDLYSRATDQFPYALPHDAAGVFLRNPGGNLSLWNPLQDIGESINERRSTAVMANVFAEIKFTPWLKYRVNFGPQFRNFRNGTFVSLNATSHLKTPGTAGYATQENFSWVVENLLYFDKTFADDHKVGVTLLQSSQKSRRENSSVSVAGLINPLSLWYDAGAFTSGTPGVGTGYTENTLTSFMGRLNYTLMNKYLVTGSFRADGASVLAPGNKWSYFPSFALAWKMQEEKFLESINWIDELKPRFGWGITGNSSVEPYTTSGPLSRNPYVFGTAAGIGYLPQLVQNPDLSWEKTAQSNFGIDFSVFKGRVSGSFEYYRQTTSDLLFRRSTPAVSGYVEKLQNIGKTRNSGIEIALSLTPLRHKDFSWTLDVTWSKNNEEILELVNGKQDMVANNLFIGQPTQIYRQYANAGVWGADAKILQKWRSSMQLPVTIVFVPVQSA